MTKEEVAVLLTDLMYAVRQLRRFGDVGRAVDALERLQSNLVRLGNEVPEMVEPKETKAQG